MKLGDIKCGDVLEYEDVLDANRGLFKIRRGVVKGWVGRNILLENGDVWWWPTIKVRTHGLSQANQRTKDGEAPMSTHKDGTHIWIIYDARGHDDTDAANVLVTSNTLQGMRGYRSMFPDDSAVYRYTFKDDVAEDETYLGRLDQQSGGE